MEPEAAALAVQFGRREELKRIGDRLDRMTAAERGADDMRHAARCAI